MTWYMPNGWKMVELPSTLGKFLLEGHVIPCQDLAEHWASTACWCQPVEDVEKAGLYLHNAYDQRESYETGRRMH